jgi:hypothetical protein
MHTYIHPVFVRAAIPAHVHTRACACPHVSAHTRASTSAVPPRTTARAASNNPPSASRPRWRAARAEKAAHTLPNVVTAAVFHAPTFALNADADLNACEPSHPRSTPTAHARMCRRVCVGAQSQTHTRARTRMHHVSIYYTCACPINGWCYEVSAPHSHTCVLPHRQRPNAIARACTNTHSYPFTYEDFASIYICIYNVHAVCVGHIYRRTYPRMSM